VKSTDGYIFGGYKDLAWDSSKKFKLDPNAFIFSLVNPLTKPELGLDHQLGKSRKGICCHSDYGPAFLERLNKDSFDKRDLLTRFENDQSRTYLYWYYRSDDSKIYFLTPERKFNFIELEVFQLTK
jgi:hypothetical protein